MEATTKIYNIYFNEEINAVVMEWNGYSTSSEFRQGTELMLNTLIQHRTSKVLADIKDMVLIGMDDQQWMDSDFLPRAIKFGFKAITIVKPKSYFNKVAVESISYKVDKDKLAISFFDNNIEAKEWLNDQV
ncbi:MAG: hypothetical protein ABI772_08730 [Bacteroidota bacterium]